MSAIQINQINNQNIASEMDGRSFAEVVSSSSQLPETEKTADTSRSSTSAIGSQPITEKITNKLTDARDVVVNQLGNARTAMSDFVAKSTGDKPTDVDQLKKATMPSDTALIADDIQQDAAKQDANDEWQTVTYKKEKKHESVDSDSSAVEEEDSTEPVGFQEHVLQKGRELKDTIMHKADEARDAAVDLKNKAVKKGHDLQAQAFSKADGATASRQQSSETTQDATTVQDQALSQGKELKDALLQKASDARDAVLDLKDRVLEKGQAMKEQAFAKADDAKAGVSDTHDSSLHQGRKQKRGKVYQKKADHVSEPLEPAHASVQEHAFSKGQEVKETLLQKAGEARDAAMDLKDRALEKGQELKEQTFAKVQNMKESTPQLSRQTKQTATRNNAPEDGTTSAATFQEQALQKGYELKDTVAQKATEALDAAIDIKDRVLQKGQDLKEQTFATAEDASAGTSDLKERAPHHGRRHRHHKTHTDQVEATEAPTSHMQEKALQSDQYLKQAAVHLKDRVLEKGQELTAQAFATANSAAVSTHSGQQGRRNRNRRGQKKPSVSEQTADEGAATFQDKALEKGRDLKDIVVQQAGVALDAAMDLKDRVVTMGQQLKEQAFPKAESVDAAAPKDNAHHGRRHRRNKAFKKHAEESEDGSDLKDKTVLQGQQLKGQAQEKISELAAAGSDLKDKVVRKGQQLKQSVLEGADQALAGDSHTQRTGTNGGRARRVIVVKAGQAAVDLKDKALAKGEELVQDVKAKANELSGASDITTKAHKRTRRHGRHNKKLDEARSGAEDTHEDTHDEETHENDAAADPESRGLLRTLFPSTMAVLQSGAVQVAEALHLKSREVAEDNSEDLSTEPTTDTTATEPKAENAAIEPQEEEKKEEAEEQVTPAPQQGLLRSVVSGGAGMLQSGAVRMAEALHLKSRSSPEQSEELDEKPTDATTSDLTGDLSSQNKSQDKSEHLKASAADQVQEAGAQAQETVDSEQAHGLLQSIGANVRAGAEKVAETLHLTSQKLQNEE